MSGSWLELLAAATLKSTLWLALAGLASLVMWRRSASLRHLAWAGAIAGALALPLLQVALPSVAGPVRQGLVVLACRSHRHAPSLSGEGQPAPRSSHGKSSGSGEQRLPTEASPVVSRYRAGLADLLLALWTVGVIVTLAPLALAFVRIGRIARNASPLAEPRWATLACARHGCTGSTRAGSCCGARGSR